MKNQDVCVAFVKGESASTANLRTDGKKLWSYNTIIGERIKEGIIYNSCRYSCSTSRHQFYLRVAAGEAYVSLWSVDGGNNGIPMGTQNLSKYFKPKKVA